MKNYISNELNDCANEIKNVLSHSITRWWAGVLDRCLSTLSIDWFLSVGVILVSMYRANSSHFTFGFYFWFSWIIYSKRFDVLRQDNRKTGNWNSLTFIAIEIDFFFYNFSTCHLNLAKPANGSGREFYFEIQ